MKRASTILAGLATTLLLCTSVLAQGTTLTLGANESPPFWSKSLPGYGLCGEILHAISQAAGIQSKIVFLPLQRLIEDDANNDLGNPIFYLPYQEYAAIIPIAIYRAAFYYHQKEHQPPPSITRLEDLVGKRVGVLKGTLIDRVHFERKGMQFEESYSQESLFKKLRLNRIDLVIEIDQVGETIIKRLFPDKVHQFGVIPLEYSASPIAIMLSEDQPDATAIAAAYRRGLTHILKEGRYLEILERHYPPGKVPEDWRLQLERFSLLYDSGNK
jgi:polar amino acid transport system substrate-binding protein